MKIIFSRKGFDSGYGGVASPIFPNGNMMSLPIPGYSGTRYKDIYCSEDFTGSLVNGLTKGKIPGRYPTHFDPDLNPKSLTRLEGWRPSLGQTGAAQSHLESQGVSSGDLFLFFGWFRQAEKFGEGIEARWRYVPKTPDLHVLFGYLQIDKSVNLGCDPEKNKILETYPWLKGHPHITPESRINNTVHIGKEYLQLLDEPSTLSGGNAFNKFSPDLILTNMGKNPRSVWKAPEWLKGPEESKSLLSYHNDPKRWTKTHSGYLLQSVAKGQEFVIDCSEIKEAKHWAHNLIHNHVI